VIFIVYSIIVKLFAILVVENKLYFNVKRVLFGTDVKLLKSYILVTITVPEL